MDVTIIDTSSLGDRSYLVSSGSTGVVIDPQRDIDRVLDLAQQRGVQITHVLETHIHNDYVTGGLELARTVSAEYVCPSATGWTTNAAQRATEMSSTPGRSSCR